MKNTVLFVGIDLKSIGGIQTYINMFVNYHKNKSDVINQIEVSKKNLFKNFFKLFYFLKISDKVYITHVSLLTIPIFIFYRKKITVCFYGIEIFKPRYKIANTILKLFEFQYYITCSNYSKKFFFKNIQSKINQNKIKLVYPYSIFEKKNFHYKKEFKKKLRILSVSRLDGEVTKGVWLAINSFISKKYENLELHIIGEGKDKLKMLEIIKKNSISNIFVHGYIDDISNHYFNSDFNLYITDQTGLGCNIIDSIYFGKPIIISKKQASYEVFKDMNYKFSIDNDEDQTNLDYLFENINKKNQKYFNQEEKLKKLYFSKYSKKCFDQSFS